MANHSDKTQPASPPRGDGAVPGPASEVQGAVTSKPIVILNPAGLHARPTAVLVSNAKRFSSAIKIVKDGREGNAKSVVGILSMQVKPHDTITVTAAGADAVEAIETLVPLIESGLGEKLHGVPRASDSPETPDAPPSPKKEDDDPDVLRGTPASPGLVTGQVFQLRHVDAKVTEAGRGEGAEHAALLEAVSASKSELAELERTMRMKADTGKAAIFAAHQELLDDPELLVAAQDGIKAGKSAAFAWRAAYTTQAEALSRLENELLAARAGDIRDIGTRVLGHLTGERHEIRAPEDAILIAPDLTPSDTAGLDQSRVLGFCTTEGSATSHASILARAAGIPAVAAVDERALAVPDGTKVVLDGERGELRLNPSPEEIERVRARQEEADRSRRQELAEAALPAETTDGHRVKVVGNISGQSEAEEIPALGGLGVGLLRSEFLFLQRTKAPSEEEQAGVYVTIAKALGPDRELVVRTLDVGGDKPLAYLPLPQEANPFLGMRGIRLNMLGTELFTAQVRAILAAAPYTRLSIMFPMVSGAAELREAKAIVLRERDAISPEIAVQIGIMVEVPSAAVMADLLAPEVDFFSIGTNDLTQYTLAIDRGHPKLAPMADALHPAVLRLIDATVQGAHKHGKWVGVCGGIAGDVSAVPVLLGLGVDELSVSVKAIPQIKATVRRQSLAACQSAALETLGMTSAEEVRAYLARTFASQDVAPQK